MSELAGKISQLYERDQQLRLRAAAAGDIPISYEAITPQWLTAVLCAGTPGATVTGFELDTPDNGSTNRRRIFLKYNEAGTRAGLPATVFCKSSHDLNSRLLLGLSGAARSETIFFNQIRPLLNVEVPRAYYAAYDPESFVSMVMLADMKGRVEFCDYNTPMTKSRALSQVQLLARLHSRFQESTELQGVLRPLGTWPEYFARCDAGFNLTEYCDVGFRRGEEFIPSRLFERAAEIWPATLKSVELHNSLPKTLTHGDVHLKNWYIVNGTDRMGLADWQNLGIGSWSRDFAYAVSTALTVENRRAWEKELLESYLEERRCAGGAEPPRFDEAFRLYRQQLPSALAWWTITLTPSPGMPDMQPRAAAVEFIRRITHAMDDLDTLESFD